MCSAAGSFVRRPSAVRADRSLVRTAARAASLAACITDGTARASGWLSAETIRQSKAERAIRLRTSIFSFLPGHLRLLDYFIGRGDAGRGSERGRDTAILCL